MEYNENNVIAYGSLSYTAERMALLLGCSIADVKEAMDGEFGVLYAKGEAQYNFEIDKKLMAMAVGGDLKALAELEKRKRRNAR